MKNVILFIFFNTIISTFLYAQNTSQDQQKREIESLVDKYSQSREKKDTVLLKNILMADIDQLVSTGEWRRGIRTAIEGMMQSSTSNPGERTLTVDNIRFLNEESAIADARYEIKNSDGSVRRMWSTFVVVNDAGVWKISAIRNMLPTGYP